VLRDVAEPEPVRPVSAELPIYEDLVRGRVRLPASPLATMRDADQPVLPHQPGDTFAGDVNAKPEPQLGQHSRRTIRCSRVGSAPGPAGTLFRQHVLPRNVGQRALVDVALHLQHPQPSPYLDQFAMLVGGRAGFAARGHVPLSGGLSFPRDDQLAAV